MIESVKKILETDTPEIELYRTMKRPKKHRDQGVFIVEGDKVIRKFFESSLQVISVLVIPELFDLYSPIIQNRPEAIEVFIASQSILQTIIGFHYHQGIMAVGKVPISKTLDDILTTSPEKSLIVALDRLESAENTGIIIRNCVAAGVLALIVGNTSIDPFLRRAVRNSMGAIFELPIIYSNNLSSTLLRLRSSFGFQIIAAHPRSHSKIISELDFKKRSCIVLGNEGVGISQEILLQCDITAKIPMMPGMDSINVSCASAVILYEAIRQRSFDY